MNRVFIIAEAGVNHNGDIELAKQLIDKAAEAKADAVKFQTFTAANIVCEKAEKAAYQIEATGQGETQFEMLKKLQLSRETHLELMKHCEKRKIIFLSTPFDLESIAMLEQLGVSAYKIPSGEITNYPYLQEIGKKGKPIFLSTGMSTMEEIKAAISILKQNASVDITVLHCNTEYPTNMEDVNLLAMETMRRELSLPVGYSDHTLGIEVSLAAVAMGAVVIEKHFTLDKNMKGPDHKASLEPEELKRMIRCIRNIECAMGNGIKVPSCSERKNMSIVRKSIVAACDIKAGDVLTEDNLAAKRPGNGVSPMKWELVIGTKAIKDYAKDEFILWEQVNK